MPSKDAGWLPLADKLVRQFEGCEKNLGDGRFLAYLCPANVWTVGWGATGPDIKRGTVWTKAQCDARLLHDLNAVYGPAVDKLLHDPALPHEKAALVSLCYNIGAGALGRSTLIRCHNDGNRRATADQFLRWNRGGGKVLRGLVKRREMERKLYLGDHRAMKAALIAGSLLLTGPGTGYFGGMPPDRFQGPATVTLKIVPPEALESACKSFVPEGMVLKGCARRAWTGRRYIIMPDPCVDGEREEYARILCHEVSHSAHGWPWDHPL